MTGGKHHIYQYMVFICSAQNSLERFHWISATKFEEPLQFWQEPKCRKPTQLAKLRYKDVIIT